MEWRASKFTDRNGVRTLGNQIQSAEGYVISRFATVEGHRFLARAPDGAFVFEGSPFTTAASAKAACERHAKGG